MSDTDTTEQKYLDLQAYFDGEMDAAERERFEAELEREPELRTELDDIGVMRELVVGGLESEAKDVPQARFEQIWDEIDSTIDRDARLQESAGTRPSIWARIMPWLRPAALPMAATAAAAAFVVVVVNSTGDPSNTEPSVASNEPVQAPAKESAPEGPEPTPEVEPAPQLAVKTPAPADDGESVDFDVPDSNEADVERIEFGGHSGHIEQLEGSRGTTTVIWIEEDDEPVDSERSL